MTATRSTSAILVQKYDFGQFCRKIFLRTVAVLVATVAVIYLTYAILLRGHFANGMAALFQNTPGMDYDAALRFYERTFRSHMDAIILLSLLLVPLPCSTFTSAG